MYVIALHCKCLLSAFLAGICLFCLSVATADEDYQLAKKLRQQGEIFPLEKIIGYARAEKDGEVLETEFEKKDGRYIYEVEILDVQGQVWEIKLDAKSGKIIKVEIDD